VTPPYVLYLHDILAVKHEIQVAEESQAKLEKWKVENIIFELMCEYTRKI
jgi:hypothetical protein